MIRLLEKKIDDPRFIKLIEEMLQAGYLEDWTFHQTYSGTPPGSICSPILANIYLHELDLFMDTLRDQFNKGKKRHANKGYAHYTGQVTRLRKQWDALEKNKTHHLRKFRQCAISCGGWKNNAETSRVETRLTKPINDCSTVATRTISRLALLAQKRMRKWSWPR